MEYNGRLSLSEKLKGKKIKSKQNKRCNKKEWSQMMQIEYCHAKGQRLVPCSSGDRLVSVSIYIC